MTFTDFQPFSWCLPPLIQILPGLYMNQIKYIRLDKLITPEFEAHQTPNEDADEELTESIRTHGILLPLLVRNVEDGTEIIFGSRRFKCAKRAGLAAVPCMITKATDSESETFKIHENIKRLPLGHIDQALTFQHLRIKFNMTEDGISVLVGKSISYISQHLTLLQSDDTLVDSVRDGRINFSVARELMQIDDPSERHRLLLFAERDGATAATAHLWLQQYNHDKAAEPRPVVNETAIATPHAPQEPLYVCISCEQSTPGSDLKLAHLCSACFNLIFDAIAAQRVKAAQDQPPRMTKQGFYDSPEDLPNT